MQRGVMATAVTAHTVNFVKPVRKKLPNIRQVCAFHLLASFGSKLTLRCCDQRPPQHDVRQSYAQVSTPASSSDLRLGKCIFVHDAPHGAPASIRPLPIQLQARYLA